MLKIGIFCMFFVRRFLPAGFGFCRFRAVFMCTPSTLVPQKRAKDPQKKKFYRLRRLCS